MSLRARRTLERLSRNLRDNSAHVEKTLRQAGIKPDRGLVYSAAKYYDALTKLAKE